ncbi:hypothetical protein I3843_03G009800 [Carya illinoinensis]|nr:hypothetical protein I3843_03G009800 [Carya illinoinensis]
MVNSQRNPFPSVIIFIFLSSVVPYCSPAALTANLTSCLTLHGINNFATFPDVEDDHSNYFELLNFSIQNLRFAKSTIPKPMAIILPEILEQLLNTFLCSRKEGPWEIRVRCGGHSYEGTSYVTTDEVPFVVIDMRNLSHVSVDLESETAWVEGGATLGETYYAIANSSNSHGFSAGTCPTVGIGGHIGGGGFGLLSRKYGVAADNVVDALLIDARGRLLDREGMGEEVFWAIRGGGGGVWGIVYAWKIQLLKVPEVVTSFRVPRPGSKLQVAELVYKWQYVAPYLEDDFYLSCFVGAGLPQSVATGISAAFNGFYLGPRSKAISILKIVFPELHIEEEDCMEMSWIESILFFSGLSNGSSVSDLTKRYLQDTGYFKGKSDYVRIQIPLTGIMAVLDLLDKEPKGQVILDPYGGFMQSVSSESIPFPHRGGNLFSIQYLVTWQEEDKNKSSMYMDWIRELYNLTTPFVSAGPRAAYINYMDLDLGETEPVINTSVPVGDAVENAWVWGEKYFLNNFNRLVSVKTSIDPNNVFKNQQGIPPMSCAGFKAEK